MSKANLKPQDINSKFINNHIDSIKLKKHLREPIKLSVKQALLISLWTITKRYRLMYFYLLCEDGMANLFALRKAERDKVDDVMRRINAFNIFEKIS